ncbi:hypothetical protein HG15A2_16960 [Adhaeretor mobilis]|uniref:Carboxypeptidase regulatory-like domain-containing protein n=1 Tax=Adhaeretor mobilis TaxID=1930276 RepID=A0A517MU62_9BACT|nr:hypothetical protein HG15A2_16960 [Adhaeretor mobilis]
MGCGQFAALALLLAVFGGCAEEVRNPNGRVLVTGEVQYNGKPLTGGSASFAVADNRRRKSRGLIKPDGTFIITNVPMGAVVISIETDSMYYGARDMYVEIPKKYTSYDTSGFTGEVKEEDNHFVLKLVDE